MTLSYRVIRFSIFLTCLIFYLAFYSGHQVSIDGMVMFQYAKALLFQHSLVMDPPVVWGSEFSISRWPIGLTLAYLPVLAFWSLFPAVAGQGFFTTPYDTQLSHNPALFTDEAYLFGASLHLLITALTAVLVFDFGLEIGFSKKKAAFAALIFGLASPAAVYTRFDYNQPLASMFLLGAMVWLVKARQRRRPFLFLSGLATGLAALTRFEFMLIPGLFLLLGALLLPVENLVEKGRFPHRRLENLAWFAVPFGFGLAMVAWWNYLRFGAWFTTGYGDEINRFIFDPDRNILALVGNLFSPGRGLFVFFPVCLFSLPGVYSLIRRDAFTGRLLGGSLLGMWVLYSFWSQWGAGLSWGPRFFIPMLPALAILSVIGFDSLTLIPRGIRVALFAGLLGIGAVFSLQGLLFNFLDFYGRFNLSNLIVDQGFYHFDFRFSPVFSGWRHLFHPNKYDILWVTLARENPEAIGVVYLLLFFAMICGIFWMRYFFICERETA